MVISRTTTSFDDAMKKGIARALKTLKNVRGTWIQNEEVLIDLQVNTEDRALLLHLK